MLRDDRRADPLLPANGHPHRFPPRADPPPRQASGIGGASNRATRLHHPDPAARAAAPTIARLSILGGSCYPSVSVPRATWRAQQTNTLRRSSRRVSGAAGPRSPTRNATGLASRDGCTRASVPPKRIRARRDALCASEIARRWVHKRVVRVLLALRDHPAARPRPLGPAASPDDTLRACACLLIGGQHRALMELRLVAIAMVRPGACGWANAIVRAVRALACQDGLTRRR